MTEKDVTKEEKSNEEKTVSKTNNKNRTRKQNSHKEVSKKQSTNEGSKRVQPKQQQVDLTPFVTNKDGDIYAITNLPEEFIATLFAWVSRSPKSFKEHLEEAITEFNIQGVSGSSTKELSDKAKAFHEKWTVGYGHSSVAEHANTHVGIEKISRLASAELELSNTFLSITEYSQRYQKPNRGQWHNPIFPESEVIHTSVEEFFHKTFDLFEQLIDGVFRYLCEKEKISPYPETNTWSPDPKQFTSDISTKRRALKKLAFEDARYVLPLAMHTQLGMTANGRAWRDALAALGNSDHQESKQLAKDLKTEITKVLPVLLKYATPSQYQRNSKKRINKYFIDKNKYQDQRFPVRLKTVKSEEDLIREVVALLFVKHEDLPYSQAYNKAAYLGKEKREEIVRELLFEMQHFDMAPDEFRHIKYDAELLVSEANWHQLLRHNRKTDFTFSNPTPHLGIKIPPRIVEAGLSDLVKGIAEESKELYNILVEEGFEKEAEYVVLNAHQRHVFASFSLWEAYHLINLRTSEEAQWDIRETFEDLFKQIYTVHPLLMSQAKRR